MDGTLSDRRSGIERRRSAGRLANVVFINADDQESLGMWETLAPENPQTTPIMVAAQPYAGKEVLSLQRPLVLRRVLQMLERVTAPASRNRRPVERAAAALRVLVVDDSFPVRKYMEVKLHELTSKPLALDFADSGDEALAKISRSSYDLVFLDVVMPGVDGYSVCKKIKSRQSAQVVMLTSKKSPFDKVKGALSGADAYITKPPQDERLKAILATAHARQSRARPRARSHDMALPV